MTDRRHRYRIVDVFTTRQFEGNPLAVFPDAPPFDDRTMQGIALELNLSETVFVYPPAADGAARLRIFTPSRELPFAGHPTVGTAFVLLDERRASLPAGGFALEEKVGPVPVRVDEGDSPMIWLSTPAIREGPVVDRALCAAAVGLSPDDILGAPPQILDAGNPTLLIPLRDKQAVDRAGTSDSAFQTLRQKVGQSFCLFVFTPTAEGAYSRMFAPELGIREDPATGSSTGPLGRYMTRHGLAPRGARRFLSEQGTKMGRRSILHIHIEDDGGGEVIEVGGHVVSVAEGFLTLQA